MIKNMAYQKGAKKEQEISLVLHSTRDWINEKSFPILVSQKLLRSMGMGQVDFAELRVKNARSAVKVYEIKSFGAISASQCARLRYSTDWLGKVLSCPSHLEILAPWDSSQL